MVLPYAHPSLVFFVVMFLYITLAVHTTIVPIWGTLYEDAFWMGPIGFVALSAFLTWYVFRLVYPVYYLVRVFPDQIEFLDTSKPDRDNVVQRSDVVRFYSQPRKWYHSHESVMSVMYETSRGEEIAISQYFTYDDVAREFYDAIASEWGPSYVAKMAHPSLPPSKS